MRCPLACAILVRCTLHNFECILVVVLIVFVIAVGGGEDDVVVNPYGYPGFRDSYSKPFHVFGAGNTLHIHVLFALFLLSFSSLLLCDLNGPRLYSFLL